MEHTFTLEVENDDGDTLELELSLDLTDEEIAYVKRLVPSTKLGFLELLDPHSGDVVFSCTPVVVH